MEINDDGTPTGRRAVELHGKIPFSDMEDWPCYKFYVLYAVKKTIYGVSFEIGNLVQFVYEKDFETYLYFNTEEEYRKQIKDCAEDEK